MRTCPTCEAVVQSSAGDCPACGSDLAASPPDPGPSRLEMALAERRLRARTTRVFWFTAGGLYPLGVLVAIGTPALWYVIYAAAFGVFAIGFSGGVRGPTAQGSDNSAPIAISLAALSLLISVLTAFDSFDTSARGAGAAGISSVAAATAFVLACRRVPDANEW